MGVVVFDSDVLIGFLNRTDAHHEAAVEVMRKALEPGTQRWLCAVNLSEILIGPIRAGAQEQVEAMLVNLSIETKVADMALAKRAAAVRARTGLKLPDAYALATAIHAEKRDWPGVRLATFDEKVRRAHADLRPASPQP
jgi:predicted nucleic acid-binding protein